MSDAMMADFNRITDSSSGQELVSAISILTEKVKNFSTEYMKNFFLR